MKVLARFLSPAGARPASGRPVLRATAVTAGCLVAVGLVGTLSMRHFGASRSRCRAGPGTTAGRPTCSGSRPWTRRPPWWPCRWRWRLGRVARPGPGRAGGAPAAGRLAGRGGDPGPGRGRPGRRPAAWAAPLAYVGEYLRSATSGRSHLPRRVPGPGADPARLRRPAPAVRDRVLRPGRPGLGRAGRGRPGHRGRRLPGPAGGGRPGPRRARRPRRAGRGAVLGPGPGDGAVPWPPRPTPCGRRCWPGRCWPPTAGSSAAPGAGPWPARCCSGWPRC